MLCSIKHDHWKCSGGYDQAYENLVLTSVAKPKPETHPPRGGSMIVTLPSNTHVGPDYHSIRARHESELERIRQERLSRDPIPPPSEPT